MRKGVRGLCALVALLLCLGTWTVYAADANMVLGSATIENGVLSVTGNLTENAAVDCTVTVFKTTDADMTLFDTASLTPAQIQANELQLISEGRLLDMTEVKTNGSGAFSYTLDLKKYTSKVGEGDYVRVTVRADGTAAPAVANGYYASSKDTTDALEDIQQSTTDAMLSYLTGEVVSGQLPVANIVGLDIEGYYSLLSSEGKTTVAAAIAGQSYSTTAAANEAFDAAVKTAAKAEIKFGSAYHKTGVVDIYDLTQAVQLTGASYTECPEADMDMNKTITQSDIDAIVEMMISAL